MKINEISDVAQHPAIARKAEFANLLKADIKEADDIIMFIMDDRNAEVRRLDMLRHLDEILVGTAKDNYKASDLQDFMFDQEIIASGKSNLTVVETEDEIPMGEYEICQACQGEGCPKCEEGLIDITGLHKIPNFDDYQSE